MNWNAVNWYTHRIAGALLIVLLVAHFWVVHFASESLLRGELSFKAIEGRVRMPLWQWIDISFLFVALYHGLNGVRNIVLDYSRIGPGAARAVTATLAVAGAGWFYWGVTAFRNLR